MEGKRAEIAGRGGLFRTRHSDGLRHRLARKHGALFWNAYFALADVEKKILSGLAEKREPVESKRLFEEYDLEPSAGDEAMRNLMDAKMIIVHHAGDTPVISIREYARSMLANAEDHDPEYEGLRQHVRSKSFLYFRYDLVSYLLNYLVTLTIARHLNVEGFGLFSVAFSVSSLAGALAPMALPLEMQRNLPVYLHEQSWGKFKGMIRFAFMVSFTVSILVMAAGGAALVFLPLHKLDSTDKLILAISYFLIPINSTGMILDSILESERKFNALFSFNMFLSPFFYLLAILGVGAVVPVFTEVHLMTTVVTIHLLIMLVKFVYYRRGYPEQAKAVEAVVKAKEWLVTALPMLLLTIFIVAIYYCDVIAVGYILGKQACGIYAAAVTTAGLLSIFQDGSNSVSEPEIAPLFKGRHLKTLQRLMTLVARLSFLPAVAAFIPVCIFGEDIMRFFGKDFHSPHAYMALVLLMITQLVKGSSGQPGTLLLMTGFQTALLKIYYWVVPLYIVAAFFLTKHFGIAGMAAANLLMMIASRQALIVLVYKKLKINTSYFGGRFFRPLAPRKHS